MALVPMGIGICHEAVSAWPVLEHCLIDAVLLHEALDDILLLAALALEKLDALVSML